MSVQAVEVEAACGTCRLTTDQCLAMREDCCTGCTHYLPTDPDAVVDEVAVERAMAGDRTVTLNRKEAAEAHARLEAHGLSSAEIAERLGTSQRQIVRWRNGHSRPITRRGHAMTDDTIDTLLAQAKRNPAKRIQSAAKRAEQAVQKVRDLIEADAGKAALRERAARLEAELRALKAEIRGGTTATVTRVDVKAVREWAAANGVEVNPQGRIPKQVIEAYTEAQAS